MPEAYSARLPSAYSEFNEKSLKDKLFQAFSLDRPCILTYTVLNKSMEAYYENRV